ncbi:hypothetical protein [Enemella evansiae]|uniref:hypothetical protein n=1 Tax=Enemella evansiae TaxID=2016499 RepID=UPI000B96D4F6|nr:hypothetical protein [Enemella evansiae]OYN98823.1 hypothetical protein CGZ97_20790 [Enemella evansiae]
MGKNRRVEVRRFELPWHAPVGRLVNPELGLASVSQRGGEYAPYTIDVTVLDAPDHRLVRAGIWLAHRVLEGRGEWYLAADGWEPWLPTERIEQLGEGDLPDELADLVRPFRRGAALGPTAALTCRREEYALRDAEKRLVAVLRNEAVQVRSGGVTTARYRQLTLTGVGNRLTSGQAAWLTESLNAAGGTQVAGFPPLAQRLGAPATGLSDLPEGRDPDPEDTLERFVGGLLAARLRRITRADLAVRGGHRRGARELAGELLRMRTELQGMVPLLDPQWSGDLAAELDWAAQAVRGATADTVPAELSGERYLRLLDRLVSASRAPALGDAGAEPAGSALTGLLRQRVRDLRRVMAGLSAEEGADGDWLAALRAAEGVRDCCGVQAEETKPVRALRRRATRLVAALDECLEAHDERQQLRLDDLTSEQAFAAGRAYERVAAAEQDARADLLDDWPRIERRLRRAAKEL